MPKISTYPLAESISLNDYLLGTQVDNDDDTRNFLLSDIQTLFGGGGGGGGAISVTKTALDALVASNGLVPGTYYIISGVDVALYGGTTILIQAATTNTLELAGHGIFYNPKYLNSQATPNNGYGIWSNYITCEMTNVVGSFYNGDTITSNDGATATYLANGFFSWISGDWSTATSIDYDGSTADVSGAISPSYAIGQDVIWGGKHWTNTSGNIGTADDKYTLSSADWTPVAFNSTDYNVVADVIHYDYSHDMIIRRKDKWNNDVDGNFQVFDEFASPDGYDFGNPIKDFQWGNGPEDWNTDDYYYIGVQSNYVKDSYLECINFIGSYLWMNTLTQQSYIYNNITDVLNSFEFNTLSINSYIYSNTLTSGEINSNTLTNGFINNNTLTSGEINSNTLTSGEINNNTLTSGQINSNTLTNGYINSNTLTSGQINSNTLTNGEINSNTLSINSQINSNILSNNSEISNNTLSSDSLIIGNILSNNSEIYNNTLTNSSFIQYNELNSGSVNNNTLSGYGSNFQYNKLNSGSVNNNTLSGNSSKFQDNKLNSGSSIYDNILNSINSSIYRNILNFGSFIYSNTLGSGSLIADNILNNSQFNFSSSGTLENAIENIEVNYAVVVFDISTASIIYSNINNYPKQIFTNSAGVVRLGYYNASDVFTIVNVNA